MANSSNGRPVLVAGGAGYIGSHTVRLLQERGIDVVVLDDLSAGHRQAVNCTLEEVNLGDRDALEDVFDRHNPRAVIHFAAKCYVRDSVQDPAVYYRNNVHFTWNLLEAMRGHDVGCIVFSSSCATYGNPVELPMTEDHPQRPISPYGRTKLHMEHMIEDFGRAYGLRYGALRYFNAAGASQQGDIGEDHDPETHLIPRALKVALGQVEEVQVFGDDYPTPDGTCIRDYIHVEDLATAHLTALTRLEGGAHRVVCNLGTGSGYSVGQVIQTAREVTGLPIKMRVVGRRTGDPPQLVSGGTGARDVLGWEARRPGIREIVEDAWRFMQSHPDGYAE
ncbi:MAG TPA: UDP-glucose 4-epimerase GalE [Planctomycetota bacterium]|nr:UDP-glucose 4-epimerase GalE [Planctomycetota bacterium]